MTPEGFSIDDLRKVLVTCAGEADNGALRGDFADTDFEELGYDSLALMETAARIERDYGVRITDSEVAAARTPHDMVNLVVSSSSVREVG
jgi:act minimal PKS acyl carrier protein